eukprot:8048339-Lingulodinium_polyedra.AAC.1
MPQLASNRKSWRAAQAAKKGVARGRHAAESSPEHANGQRPRLQEACSQLPATASAATFARRPSGAPRNR